MLFRKAILTFVCPGTLLINSLRVVQSSCLLASTRSILSDLVEVFWLDLDILLFRDMGLLFKVSCKQMLRLVVNVICVDVLEITIIFYRLNQVSSRFGWFWRFWDVFIGSVSDDMMAASSAKVTSKVRNMSAVNIRCKNGPNILPCGTVNFRKYFKMRNI